MRQNSFLQELKDDVVSVATHTYYTAASVALAAPTGWVVLTGSLMAYNGEGYAFAFAAGCGAASAFLLPKALQFASRDLNLYKAERRERMRQQHARLAKALGLPVGGGNHKSANQTGGNKKPNTPPNNNNASHATNKPTAKANGAVDTRPINELSKAERKQRIAEIKARQGVKGTLPG